ncbi:WxL protein peptidoglycan domain-containing protein [Isoptericola sp. NPDC056578]|uniref:WxL protein peptidoglycan domain-containing protein n=1 Tax=Isoptericola sp. NPDC056578 TaxID=3345870 RepID=UPI0036CEEB1C
MSTHHRPSSRRAPSRVRAAAAAVLATAAVAVVLPAPATAHAASDDLTWSLAPKDGTLGAGRANFAYDVEPGERVRDVLVVTNRSAAPLELSVYGTDAVTTPSGHLDLLPADQEPTDLGAWLTLDAGGEGGDGTVTIEPGDAAEVPFSLSVPDDATPGDHAGGVVTSLRQQVGDGALSVDRRLALRVHARVGGALAPGLAVSDVGVVVHPTANPVGASRATVTYTLTNTGNARLVPTESVRLTGPGASAGAGGAPAEELLPGAVVRRTVQVDGVRPTFRVAADVRADGLVVGVGGGGATTATATAAGWAVPWALLGVVVLVVAGAAAWPLWRTRPARRGSSGSREVAPVPAR